MDFLNLFNSTDWVMSLRRGDYFSRMHHFLFTWRDQEFEFFKFWSATFLLPVVGWIFWICFLGRPETFFTFDCSLNCCILLPLVGSIFPFCLFSVDLGSLFCWKLEFLFLLLYSELGRLIEWFDSFSCYKDFLFYLIFLVFQRRSDLRHGTSFRQVWQY